MPEPVPPNVITVLGEEFLLVGVGTGSQVHVAAADDGEHARPAVEPELWEAWQRRSPEVRPDYDMDQVLAPRWRTTTLCGRVWCDMAAGEGGPVTR